MDKINKDRSKMNRQLYVLPCFLKPGKQTFVVQSKVFDNDLCVNVDEAAKMMASSRSSNTSALSSASSDPH